MVKLTVKQDAFVKRYLLNGGNATNAALEAGYSANTASEMGYENLSKPQIKEAIEKHQKKGEESFIWSKKKKLEMLEKIAEKATSYDPEKGMINMVSAIAAIKEHNAMQGHNAPTETVSNINATTSLVEILTGGSKR